jgi:amidase
MNMESAQALAFELATAPEKLSPGLLERMLEARAAPTQRLIDGRAAFHAAQDAFAGAIEGFDAVLTPAAPDEAPLGLENTGDPVFNSLWTLLHTPAVSVPIGHGAQGLPLGAQIVTPLGEDAACLMWGEWVRQAVMG